ncbi:MAG: DUF3570 domain-containing protein [Pseudomonadota bacterium]
MSDIGSLAIVAMMNFSSTFQKISTCSLILLFSALAGSAQAAVLPEERGDILYHSYDGGGATIDGPAVLVRKNFGESVSVGVNHYVDNVTSASIDVVVNASEYTENREENTLSVDYLNEKTTISFGYTKSIENDFDATTLNLGISQEMFGDLTTLTVGFALGDNIIGQNGDDDFEETAEVRSYRLSLTQILTKKLIMSFAFDTTTDEGFLNNPYRVVRYRDPVSPVGYLFQPEVYPQTRTSNAFAIRANYYLEQHAAIHTGYRFFTDSWGIEASTYELGYILPYGEDWIFEASFRFHDQGEADFYSDLFPFQDAQNFLARDKEMSSFSSTTIGAGVSWEFGRAWEKIERGALSLNIDWIQFDYDNFRDLTDDSPVGTESLYEFDATVIRAFASIWF